MHQYRDCGGVYREGEGRRYGGQYKRGKNQEDREIGGGMCPVCGR